MAISIAQVIAEHHHDGFGLFTTTPRLSWRFNATTVRDWKQASYDMRISRNGQDESYHVVSPESILVPWPSSSLASRERASVKVRATGRDGQSTDWASLSVEVALLYRSDWSAELISGPPPGPGPKRPFRLRRTFRRTGTGPARLYATAHGVYEVEINGRRVGDHLLAPGWQSYQHRLHYQTYDVTSLLQEGKNVIGAHIAEGWFATRLGRPGVANIWGNRLGFLGQVEIEGEVVCASDASWDHLEGPLISSELYNGEICDSNLEDPTWSTTSATTLANGRAHVLPFPTAELIAPEVAPVRQVMELKAKKVITTPSGKKILDFGQNFVGWLRVEKTISSTPDNRDLIIRHAEVMEHEELGIRPLRTAKCQYTLKLGGPTRNAQTRFTFYGFRFAEITGYDDVCVDDFTGVVISSDLRRTGGFESSHAMLNKLHANTVWSMRGNFVSVPTDCPQRDERLGWTGDLQVFAPTANFLYDTAAFLGSWMRDVEAEQRDAGGVVPVIIPNIPKPPDNRQNRPMAIWADCAVITPWDLYNAFGDKTQLATQWESMRLWLDLGVPRDEKGFYSTKSLQYGDWLDPRAPANMPGNGPTDNFMVANAYLICTTDLAGKVGRILGKAEAAERYEIDAARLRDLFRDEYVTKTGRLACDTQTSYALALRFGLFDDEQMATACGRLDYLTRWEQFKITTGFAGTPMILKVLADNGMLNLAYRMLQERDHPSWLYPVGMGATTIWERWNSMLPDGTINPGQMTSFNHYALGSVCAFMHNVVGGLSPALPGWKKALVKPQPGGTVRSARTWFDSPYGPYEVDWRCEGSKMTTRLRVPPNAEARVVLEGIDQEVGSGEYVFETLWETDPEWPPSHIAGPQGDHCLGRRSRFENLPALTRSLRLDAVMLILARSLPARNDQLASLVFVGYGQQDVERARRGWVSSKQLVQPGPRRYFDRVLAKQVVESNIERPSFGHAVWRGITCPQHGRSIDQNATPG
ncbi:hypothetical protein BN1723_005333, partial [Verticillium longisporum]